MSREFPEIQKQLAFGFMRLPMEGEEIDIEQVKEMVDCFMQAGFNYFDTAHGYHNGKSELAIKAAVTSRYPREKYVLTNKLTGAYFKNNEEIRPFFANQLEWCGVEYFDFYLMHAQTAKEFEKFKACRAYETALELKKEGKIRHFGISFHDKAEVLDRILTEYPQIEVVQIQFNYVDFEDVSVESRKVYEMARKHGKEVFVMEPVKGGSLVNLPKEAQEALDTVNRENGTALSNASFAIRFAAGFEGMAAILSGMSNLEQLKDNVSYMKDFAPLSENERAAVQKIQDYYAGLDMIKCTACRYCIEENHCPKNIRIPDVFASYNSKTIFRNWNADFYYNSVLTAEPYGKASDCVGCRGCEKVCPQHLPITQLLEKVAAEFEHSED